MAIGKRYIIKDRKKEGGEVMATFFLDGNLKSIAFSISCTKQQRVFIFKNFPFAAESEAEMIEYIDWLKKKGVPVEEIPADLSFDRFYETYGIKQNRKRALAFWNKMKPAAHVLAFLGIPNIKRHYNRKGWPLPLPYPYLKDERYNDEY